MEPEILDFYEGRGNVFHVVNSYGKDLYYSGKTPLKTDVKNFGGAYFCIIEDKDKCILSLYNNEDKKVRRYYAKDFARRKSPQWFMENIEYLYYIYLWNNTIKGWIMCLQYEPPKINKNTQTTNIPSLSYNEIKKRNEEEAEETVNKIREYGTSNPKKIQEIKQERKSNERFWWAIIMIFIVGYMAIGGIMRCAGVKGDPFNSCSGSTEYQYRHTDRIY